MPSVETIWGASSAACVLRHTPGTGSSGGRDTPSPRLPEDTSRHEAQARRATARRHSHPALHSGVSFVIAEIDSINGKAEALVSFWGEPFMAVHHDRKIPGSIIHVRAHSELIGRLREVERACRMQ